MVNKNDPNKIEKFFNANSLMQLSYNAFYFQVHLNCNTANITAYSSVSQPGGREEMPDNITKYH